MTYEWREAPEAEYAVLGDPVAHSLSPEMWTAVFKHFKLDHRYVKIRVPEGELPDALDHLASSGYRGVNVTVPHKSAAAAWCSDQSPEAEGAGAVNTILLGEKRGWLTDVGGFRALLAGVEGPVLLLGAGGTAHAAAVALQGRRWAVWNRTEERGRALAARFGGEFLTEADPAGFAVVANLTSASLDDKCPPVLWDRLAPGTLCVDAAYRRDGGETAFLREARVHGANVRDGRIMLGAQGAEAVHLLSPPEFARIESEPVVPSGLNKRMIYRLMLKTLGVPGEEIDQAVGAAYPSRADV